MPTSRSPAADLVEVVRELLAHDLLPTATGDRRSQRRVAVNALARRRLDAGER